MSIWSAIGGIAGAGVNLWNAQKNVSHQKEFAKHGIQWKVADAKKAGIHPLAALGAPVHSFSPVSVGDAGTSLSSAGQDLSRAMDATRTGTQRLDAVSKTVQDLTLTNLSLRNDLLAAQIAKVRQGQAPAFPGDPMLIEGQAQSGIVVTNPSKRASTAPGDPGTEAAAFPETGLARNQYGWYPHFSKDMADRMDEDHIGSAMYTLRNRILPALGFGKKPPGLPPLRPGYYWDFHPVYGWIEKRYPDDATHSGPKF